MKQNRRERNELLEKLQIKLDEMKKNGKGSVAELNVPKKPKRSKIIKEQSILDVLKASRFPKEKKITVEKPIIQREPIRKETRLNYHKERSLEGKIKWYSQEKGYGFISAVDGIDYFFHYTELTGTKYTVPVEGDAVSFKAGKSEKGMKATQVSKQE